MKKMALFLLVCFSVIGVGACNGNLTLKADSDIPNPQYTLTGKTGNWVGEYKEATNDGQTKGKYIFHYVGKAEPPFEDVIISMNEGMQILRGDVLEDKEAILLIEGDDVQANRNNAIQAFITWEDEKETMVLSENGNDKIVLEGKSENWTGEYVEAMNGDAYDSNVKGRFKFIFQGELPIENVTISMTEKRSGGELYLSELTQADQGIIETGNGTKNLNHPIAVTITWGDNQKETMVIQ